MKWREKTASHLKEGKKQEKKENQRETFVSLALFALSNDCAWETSQLPWNVVRAMVFHSLSVAGLRLACVCVFVFD